MKYSIYDNDRYKLCTSLIPSLVNLLKDFGVKRLVLTRFIGVFVAESCLLFTRFLQILCMLSFSKLLMLFDSGESLTVLFYIFIGLFLCRFLTLISKVSFRFGLTVVCKKNYQFK